MLHERGGGKKASKRKILTGLLRGGAMSTFGGGKEKREKGYSQQNNIAKWQNRKSGRRTSAITGTPLDLWESGKETVN